MPLASMPLIPVSPGRSSTPSATERVRLSVSSCPSPMAASPWAMGSESSRSGSAVSESGLSVTIFAGLTQAGPVPGATSTTMSSCVDKAAGSLAVRLSTSVLVPVDSVSCNPARAAFTCAVLPVRVMALPEAVPALSTAPAFAALICTVSVPPAGSLTVIPGGRSCSDDSVASPASTVSVAGAEMFSRLVTAGTYTILTINQL